MHSSPLWAAWPRAVLGLAVLVFSTALASAASTVLLLDRSKSMRAYYRSSPVVETLYRGIRSAAGGRVDLAVFSTQARSVQSFDQVLASPMGDFTYLDRALDLALQRRHSVVWIVTDNMQSEVSAPEAHNTEVFYERLKEDSVRRVTIFPVLQSRRPGLVAYCLLIEGDDDDYRRQVEGLSKSASNLGLELEALAMKPLDRNTIEIESVGDSQTNRYQEGDNIKETLVLRFHSKFEHLIIEDAVIRNKNSRADFGDQSLLRNEKSDVVVTPQEVRNLQPKDFSSNYTVDFDLGKVSIKRDFTSLLKAAFGRPIEDRILTLSLSINVPQENFKFRPDFLKKYAAADSNDAKRSGKIYGVERLPMLLGDESTLLVSEHKLPIRIDYPWFPSVLFILAFLVGATVIGAAAIRLIPSIAGLINGARWSIVARQSNKPVEGSVSANGQVTVAAQRVGVIKNDRFVTAAGVSLTSPRSRDGSVALMPPTPIRIRTGRAAEITLEFKRGRSESAASRKPKAAVRKPRRR